MSAAPTPDREIRLTEIPGELRRLREEADHWRTQQALEFTRAEAAEREVKRLRESLKVARDTLDDLTEHSVSQGAYIGKIDIELHWLGKQFDTLSDGLAEARKLRDEWRVKAEDAHSLACQLLDSIQYRAKYNDKLRDSVASVLDEHPALIERCEECGGYDADADPTDVCLDCFGGNVIKEFVR